MWYVDYGPWSEMKHYSFTHCNIVVGVKMLNSKNAMRTMQVHVVVFN